MMRTRRYYGIRPLDPGGRDGLFNSERGWRIEGPLQKGIIPGWYQPGIRHPDACDRLRMDPRHAVKPASRRKEPGQEAQEREREG